MDSHTLIQALIIKTVRYRRLNYKVPVSVGSPTTALRG